jgi:hypothetical protein
MRWRLSNRSADEARPLADRHYNRQRVGATGFVPPGACKVLVAGNPVTALWVSSWPIAEYVHHAWAGAWMNTLFRNEGAGLSSELIREAVAATRGLWGDPPPMGMITFVDATKIRRKRDPGRCYRRAGFEHVGFTQKGLWTFQLLPVNMPDPAMPIDGQLALFSGTFV